MSVLIQTKYLGPTNNKGSRIKAQLGGMGSGGAWVVISYPINLLENVDSHKLAVQALCDKLKIEETKWVNGWVPCGYVFISVDSPA